MEEQGVRILWTSQSKREMRLMMMTFQINHIFFLQNWNMIENALHLECQNSSGISQ